MKITDNTRITQLKTLTAPATLLEQLPLEEKMAHHIITSRWEASQIIHGKDHRLLVVVGPCSIHDPKSAIEYASRLKCALKTYRNELFLVMRVYFEKPRTTIGWKGLINDPYLDESFDINHGIHTARNLLLEINRLGLATGSEFLDTFTPQYIADLTSWSAIGARTSESQLHRELASGLSMPVGFKNATTGSIQIAVDAICAAAYPHHFLGISKLGVASIMKTRGNEDAHIILRGSQQGPNYDPISIRHAIELLMRAQQKPRLMVDLSHGNSHKNYQEQKTAAKAICNQLQVGSQSIMGVMIESHLQEGRQSLKKGEPLIYGQSITDACLNFKDTLEIFDQLAEAVQIRRNLGVLT